MKQIEALIASLADQMFEREEVIAVSLLCILSGQSIFLYGPPGTAKSLIARRLAQAFESSTHFEYLMHRFSTPEEVFGPVSILELKNDKYLRKTKGYLPKADFAFLDEIWKSSPAILNTLLTILNERLFRNGELVEHVPLKGIIAASNEVPPANQGLEALYDRFIMRMVVEPMRERDNFERLLNGTGSLSTINASNELKFSHKEWEEMPSLIQSVQLSGEVLNIIHAIKTKIGEYNTDNPEHMVYVSDRRWQKISQILKTAAFLCNRETVIPVDTLLLRHSLWTSDENRDDLETIIEKAIQEFGASSAQDLNEWVSAYNDLTQDIQETFFHTEDIYHTEIVKNLECFPITSPKLKKQRYEQDGVNFRLYAPTSYIRKTEKFHPFMEDGSIDKRIVANFNGGEVCNFFIDDYVAQFGWNEKRQSMNYSEWFRASPSILFKIGSSKSVTPRVKTTFVKACTDLLSRINMMIEETKKYIEEQKVQNHTPFVPVCKRDLILNNLEIYLNDLENHQLNAEHQLEKVKKYAVSK